MKLVEKALVVLIVTVLFSAFLVNTVFVKAEEGFSVFLPVAFRGEQPTAMPTVEPTATPKACTWTPTGKGLSLPFSSGNSVVGFRLVIGDAVCESTPGSTCWLRNAPAAGVVTDGAICLMEEEIPSNPEWVPVQPTTTPTATATATATVSPTDTPVATPTVEDTVEPTATATATETATPTKTPTPERRVTGDGGSLVFQAGEEVFGWKIMLLPSGRTCDGGNCWLPSAPEGGVVTSGVVNPWSSETVGITPWVPQY